MPDARRDLQALCPAMAAPKNKHARHKAGHVADQIAFGSVLFEVIGGADVGGAFDRAAGGAERSATTSRSRTREQRRIMVGAELIIPVPEADIGVPDARLAPEYLRRIERQPGVFEDFRL